MQESLDIRRFVVISTGHVSEKTATMLDETPSRRWPFAGGSYDEIGWFAYVHHENVGLDRDRIPDELFAVMTWARQKDVDYILFDRDGGRIDDLPFFDW